MRHHHFIHCLSCVFVLLAFVGCPGDDDDAVDDDAGDDDAGDDDAGDDDTLESGDLMWVRQVGGPDSDYGEGLCLLPDGSMAWTGEFAGTMKFGDQSNPEAEITSDAGEAYVPLFASHGPDGDLRWAFPGDGTSWGGGGRGCGTDEDGQVLFAGFYSGSLTVTDSGNVEKTLDALGPYDAYLVRFDQDGSVTSMSSLGTPDAQTSWTTAVGLEDGSTVAIGGLWEMPVHTPVTLEASAGGQQVLTGSGGDVPLVARFDPDGTLAWARVFDGPANESKSLTAVEGGDVVVLVKITGQTEYGDGTTSQGSWTADGYSDLLLARIAVDGSLVWDQQIRSNCNMYARRGLTTLSDGSLVVGGRYSDQADPSTDSPTMILAQGTPEETTFVAESNYGAMFVARFTADGTMTWAREITGTAALSLVSLFAGPDETLAVAGRYNGDLTIPAAGGSDLQLAGVGTTEDAFLLKLDGAGGALWARAAGGNGYEHYLSAAIDETGAVWALGQFSAQADAVYGSGEPNETTLESAGNNDIVLTRHAP